MCCTLPFAFLTNDRGDYRRPALPSPSNKCSSAPVSENHFPSCSRTEAPLEGKGKVFRVASNATRASSRRPVAMACTMCIQKSSGVLTCLATFGAFAVFSLTVVTKPQNTVIPARMIGISGHHTPDNFHATFILTGECDQHAETTARGSCPRINCHGTFRCRILKSDRCCPSAFW